MCEVVSGDIESVERDICGKCEVSEESDGSLWVKRADERIHISMDMLDAIARGQLHFAWDSAQVPESDVLRGIRFLFDAGFGPSDLADAGQMVMLLGNTSRGSYPAGGGMTGV